MDEKRSYDCLEVGGWVGGGERLKKTRQETGQTQPNPPTQITTSWRWVGKRMGG